MAERDHEDTGTEHGDSFWQRPGVKRVLRALLWTFGAVAAYLFAVTVVLLYGWGFDSKTLFDWMDVLVFPAVLAVGVYLLNLRQNQREQKADERRRQRELEVEEQRAQDAALQQYLDQMSHLLLERGLRNSGEEDEVQMLARARTITVLARLDPNRKGSLLQFLYETNLINKENPIIRLGGFSTLKFIAGAANLENVDLSFSNLGNIDLSGTSLNGANFAFCSLIGANLSETDLNKADLERADLTDANLQLAVMGGANLDAAILSSANLEAVNFWNSSLREANLCGANLQEAEFAISLAFDTTGTDTQDADLTGADLTKADLRSASITEEQLAQCASLKGATMPDGSNHD